MLILTLQDVEVHGAARVEAICTQHCRANGLDKQPRTSRQLGWLLGPRLRRQAPRLRRAAKRRWGLTAHRGRAKGTTMPQMRTRRSSPVLKVHAR